MPFRACHECPDIGMLGLRPYAWAVFTRNLDVAAVDHWRGSHCGPDEIFSGISQMPVRPVANVTRNSVRRRILFRLTGCMTMRAARVGEAAIAVAGIS